MPKCLSTLAKHTKHTTVITTLNKSVSQNPNLGNRYGKTKNIGKVGTTYQKVYQAWLAILSSAWFSRNNQIKVRTVTKGNAAIKPPSLSLRLATSEINTTTPAVSRYLKIIHIMRTMLQDAFGQTMLGIKNTYLLFCTKMTWLFLWLKTQS